MYQHGYIFVVRVQEILEDFRVVELSPFLYPSQRQQSLYIPLVLVLLEVVPDI
jgi:hypothetical protein